MQEISKINNTMKTSALATAIKESFKYKPLSDV